MKQPTLPSRARLNYPGLLLISSFLLSLLKLFVRKLLKIHVRQFCSFNLSNLVLPNMRALPHTPEV